MEWNKKMEIFSVRSAYFLLKEMEDQMSAFSSILASYKGVWNRLWKLKIPNADKHFLWRAYNDILPTQSNLHKRKMVDDDLCPICG